MLFEEMLIILSYQLFVIKSFFLAYFIKVEEALGRIIVTFGISVAIIPNFKGVRL